jgi:tyrosinase
MDLRKNQANMTADEKKAFVNAVLALKNKTPSRLDPKTPSRYDDYVQIHMNAMMAEPTQNDDNILGWAHKGPAILPWHRYFIRQFELDLQTIDPSVTLPYWDWTIDNSPTSSIWNPDFMGGNGRPSDDRVMDGQFAFDAGNWKLNFLDMSIADDPEGPDLKRHLAPKDSRGQVIPLPTLEQVTNALIVVPYYVAPWRAFVDMKVYEGPVQPSFCNYLEGWYGDGRIHNNVHGWVGGSMDRMTSPNDPVFFLHHCNIDRLWALWQQLHPTESYLPVAGGQYGHNLTDPMMPWGKSDSSVTPSSVLNYWALGYQYNTDLPHIELTTPSLEFNVQLRTDGRGKGTIYQAIVFKVQSYTPVTLQIISDLPSRFGMRNDSKSITVQPNICNRSSTAQLWVSYTPIGVGSTDTGSVTIKAVETGQTWTLNLSGNAVAATEPLAAVEMVQHPQLRQNVLFGPRVLFGSTQEDKAAKKRGNHKG